MNGDAVDTGQSGAARSVPTDTKMHKQVFTKFRERMKELERERVRASKTLDKSVIV